MQYIAIKAKLRKNAYFCLCNFILMKYWLKPFWFLYLICIFLPFGLAATLLTAVVTFTACSLGDDKVWGYYPGKWWARFMCLLTFSPVECKGMENIDKTQSYIFAANHGSIYDVFVIYGYIGVPFKWIMRQELRKIPFIGAACAAAGHIFIKRENRRQSFRSLQTAENKLAEGVSVVIFPEGTRTRTGETGKFKRGAFHIAADLDLPIVPVSISGAFRIMPRNKIYPVPGHLKLTVHKPVPFKPENHDEEMEQIEAIRQAVISAV